MTTYLITCTADRSTNMPTEDREITYAFCSNHCRNEFKLMFESSTMHSDDSTDYEFAEICFMCDRPFMGGPRS
jgi:hypothetical protein